ncbi:MAG: hypothetical protein L3J62_06775 [Gammaproteobacteria bacterium]|nr:hypothetical protein [Gammaproteobacteria bacterium]MCF6230480.1 hypothetical protein [Gammaproteobacteria bacterium]
MKLQDKLANSVRQIKTQQAEPKKRKTTATTQPATPEATPPPLPSKRTWPD